MIYKKVIASPNHRLLVVGDIHGRYDLLKKAIAQLNITAEDTFLSVGDLIDRGPNSKECLDYFLTQPNRHFIIGNHEQMMLDRNLHSDFMDNWLYNGGRETQEQLGDEIELYCEHISNNAPYILEVQYGEYKYGLIHAEVPFEQDGSETLWNNVIKRATIDPMYQEKLIWNREVIEAAFTPHRRHAIKNINGIDQVIHGHTPISVPMIESNRIWIDTLYGGSNSITVAFVENGNWAYHSIS